MKSRPSLTDKSIILYRQVETTAHITPELDKYSILDLEIYRNLEFCKSLINYRHSYLDRCSFSRSKCCWGSNPIASPLASPAQMAADKAANRWSWSRSYCFGRSEVADSDRYFEMQTFFINLTYPITCRYRQTNIAKGDFTTSKTRITPSPSISEISIYCDLYTYLARIYNKKHNINNIMRI